MVSDHRHVQRRSQLIQNQFIQSQHLFSQLKLAGYLKLCDWTAPLVQDDITTEVFE